ncbi:hypothetical protein M434DRAFT_289836 [Hypoxylon sp. CO27-5]|nr:hypothetical protein M434DRAFT_289836 [Hypoxylon sp. CO27-5]
MANKLPGCASIISIVLRHQIRTTGLHCSYYHNIKGMVFLEQAGLRDSAEGRYASATARITANVKLQSYWLIEQFALIFACVYALVVDYPKLPTYPSEISCV